MEKYKPKTHIEGGWQALDPTTAPAPEIPAAAKPVLVGPGELPQRVEVEGVVYDLDTGEAVRPPMLSSIAGVMVDLAEWGTNGGNFLREFYENFLQAVHQGQKSEFWDSDEDGQFTHILNYLPEPRLRNLLHLDPEDGATLFVPWTQDRIFEEYVGFAIATLRWRIKEDLTQRYLLGRIATRSFEQETRAACEVQLVVLEKYWAASERKRLTAV